MKDMRNMEDSNRRFSFNNLVPYLFLLSIIVLGFILRLYHLKYYIFMFVDSIWYTYTSILFSKGVWLSTRTATKGPFFNLILSLFFSIFEPTFSVSRSLSLLFGSLIPVPIYFLSSEFFSKRTGLLAAFVVSINPLLILYSCNIFREPLFSFILMSSLFFTLRGFKGNYIYSIMGGILFAFLSMTIEVGIFFGIGVLFYYLIQKIMRKEKNIIYNNLDIFFCCSFLTMIPFLLRNYFAYGDPIRNITRSLGSNLFYVAIMWAYFGLIALTVPYVLIFRVLFTQARRPSADRYTKFIRYFLMGFGTLIAIAFIGSSIAIYILGSKVKIIRLLSLNSMPIRWTLGFIKLIESLAAPESLGFLLFVLIFVIIYSLKSSNYAIIGLFSIFLFYSATFMIALPSHYRHFSNLTFDEIIAHHPTLPFDNALRYCTTFIPLFSIIVSYGIFSFTKKLENSLSRKKREILETILVFMIVSVIALQFFFADTNLRIKANCDQDTLIKHYSSISWLSVNGSPRVFGFSPLIQEIYGEDKVVLLTDESLNEIAQRASQEKIEYIVVDMSGTYSNAQLALFFRGWREDESWMNLRSFSLIMNTIRYPFDQLYRISLIEPSKKALLVQHSNMGKEWVPFLSDRYFVDVVDDGENLTPHLSGDYKLIVFEDIMRPLEDDEINVLRERVADGGILIVTGLSPARLRLKVNSQFFGAKIFLEAPKDSKCNITFLRDALNIMPNIDLNNSFTLYSEKPWSSPTGCVEIGNDAVVYAKRATDGAAVIFAKPYFKGIVIFSGVRNYYASNARDHDLYMQFIQNTIDKAYNNTLITAHEQETQEWFKGAIFSNSKWDANTPWERILTIMVPSIRNLDETSSLLDIDLSEFDIVVFADFLRLLDDMERVYLEESIERGLTVIVSGISPPYLAGGGKDLTSIKTWFGATDFSEAPKEERWKVKFKDSAIEIMDLDLEYEYAFYTIDDWTSPTGCVVQPESDVYAYRINDGAGTIFLNKYGEGTSIFIGSRFGFSSPDKGTFEVFLQSLIRAVLTS